MPSEERNCDNCGLLEEGPYDYDTGHHDVSCPHMDECGEEVFPFWQPREK